MKELISIQSELKAPKSQYNAFGKYKYRNCEDILEAVKPLLAKNSCTLVINDDVVAIGNRVYIKATATIKNSNGEEISSNAFAREELEKKGMDAAQCFDLETELLTKDGWKKYDEVKIGDRIYNFDIYNGCISEDAVRSVIYRPVLDGEYIYRLKNQFYDFCVTDNHNLLLKGIHSGRGNRWSLHPANILDGSSKLKMLIAAERIGNSMADLTDNECILLGLTLSDGHKESSKRWCISQSKKENLQKIRDLIAACGLEYDEKVDVREGKDVNCFPNAKDLHKFSYHSSDKMLPFLDRSLPGYESMSKHQFLKFIEGYFLGNGMNKKGGKSYMGIRKETVHRMSCGDRRGLVDRMQLLCTLNGFYSQIYAYKSKVDPDKDLYIIGINTGLIARGVYGLMQNPNKIWKRKLRDGRIGETEIKLSVPTKEIASGHVWCVETFNRTTITRRGGKVFISGNCSGSSSSYARKYALNGLFLIDDTKDSDFTNKHDDKNKPTLDDVLQKVANSTTIDELSAIWNEYESFRKEEKFTSAISARKQAIQ